MLSIPTFRLPTCLIYTQALQKAGEGTEGDGRERRSWGQGRQDRSGRAGHPHALRGAASGGGFGAGVYMLLARDILISRRG